MKIATMPQLAWILDLAKNVFQLHGVDADGRVVVRRRLRRSEVIKASWAWRRAPGRIIGRGSSPALGHEVRLMPPAYVKAYVRRQKNDNGGRRGDSARR